MLRITEDNRKYDELTAVLNKAREIGDIAEMWRCATELVVMDRRRGATLPIFGSLSDRIGRRAVYGGGALAAALFMIPYFWMMDSGSSSAVWFGVSLLGGCIYSALAGSQPAFFSELFPANVRYTGVAGAREFGAIAGGAIPLIAAALSAAYASATPVALFVICMCVVTIIAVILAPETRGKADTTS